jgi:hypothetical protein
VFITLLLASASVCSRKERHKAALPTATASPSVLASTSTSTSTLPSARAAPSAAVTAVTSGRPARVLQMFVTDEFGGTTCSMTDYGHTFRGRPVIEDREIYSFPRMNEHLRKYPAFARAAGLREVKTCEDARRYAERYQEYERAHSGFDFEGPTKEEQFREFLNDQRREAAGQ